MGVGQWNYGGTYRYVFNILCQNFMWSRPILYKLYYKL